MAFNNTDPALHSEGSIKTARFDSPPVYVVQRGCSALTTLSSGTEEKSRWGREKRKRAGLLCII